ncbi:thioesterase II family protein [Actinokineospora guangxiensis]|uniref:Thioesterase II family protein n=1 Tax=Actinokineospora guangxiensis TaxID=1490288 RepID=A0ABW0EVD8_9PSEU
MTAVSTPLWVRRFHAREKTTRFVVCFSHAGGSASYFFPFSELLPDDVEVLAVQYPGRHDRYREAPFEHIEDFVDPIAAALEPYLEHQVAFFGHSLGALVGFEVTRRLEERGHTLTTFFASGRRAPSTWRDERPETLTDEEFITEIQKLNGTSAAAFADEDLVRMVLPTLRSDYTAAANYPVNTDRTIKSPVVALIGDDDPKCTIAEAEAWSGHARGGFAITVFPGGHFYLDNHRQELATVLAGAFS